MEDNGSILDWVRSYRERYNCGLKEAVSAYEDATNKKINMFAESRKPIELPKVRVGNKTYYVDSRLQELRNINNPHDKLEFE